MKPRRRPNATAAFEKSHAEERAQIYELRLYVAGMTARSVRAIASAKAICEEHLHGRYHLQVIDIYQSPRLLVGQQIIAVPTLIKELPGPLRRIIGDLSNRESVLIGLDLKPRT